MYRYRVIFYPMLNQTLAVVATMQDDDYGERIELQQYALKTFGEDPWPVAHLLRELADRIDAQQF